MTKKSNKPQMRKKTTAEAALVQLHRKTTKLQHAMGEKLSDQLDPRMLLLMDEYGVVRQTGEITDSFLKSLQVVHDAHLISDQGVEEMLQVLHANLPELPQEILVTLKELNVDIRSKVRPAFPLKKQGFSLGWFTFDEDDQGPHFDIEKVYRAVDLSLRKAGQSWSNLAHFSDVSNPMSPQPERLNYYMVRRVYLWHKCFQGFRDYFETLSAKNQRKLKQYDLLLYPHEVAELQRSFLTRVWDGLGPIRGAVSYAVASIFQNQLMIMVARNLLCIGMVLFMVQFLGLNISMLKFVAELMLGYFLQRVWSFLFHYVLTFPLTAATFSFLGPLGAKLYMLIDLLQGKVPASVLSSGLQAAVMGAFTVFGSGWVVGLGSMGLGELVMNKLGWGSLLDLWISASKELYQMFTRADFHNGTLSALFAIHGVKFICTMFGWDEEDSYCNQFASLLSYTLAGVSIGHMLIEIMSDIRMFYHVVNLARQPGVVTVQTFQLEDMAAKSSCIQAVYTALRVPTNDPITVSTSGQGIAAAKSDESPNPDVKTGHTLNGKGGKGEPTPKASPEKPLTSLEKGTPAPSTSVTQETLNLGPHPQTLENVLKNLEELKGYQTGKIAVQLLCHTAKAGQNDADLWEKVESGRSLFGMSHLSGENLKQALAKLLCTPTSV